MGYYPDMSSQAAAQSYFEELVQRAIASGSTVQRLTGSSYYVDIGMGSAAAGGGVTITPSLGGRGLMAAFATFANANPITGAGLRVVLVGPTFEVHNDSTAPPSSNFFWLAVAL